MDKKIDWGIVFKKTALILGIGVGLCEAVSNAIDFKRMPKGLTKLSGPKKED